MEKGWEKFSMVDGELVREPYAERTYTVRNLRRVFEEYKGKTGWRGLDAENAIESFIRFVEKGA